MQKPANLQFKSTDWFLYDGIVELRYNIRLCIIYMKQMLAFNIQSSTVAFMSFIPKSWFGTVDYITEYFAHIFKWCYWFLLIYLNMNYRKIKLFKYIP